MKKIHILLSASIGTLIYVLVNLFFGSSGIWAESQLIKQRNLLSENVISIQKINNELELEYTALLNDPEVIASYAHSLGFVQDGEYIVKFTGIPTMSEKVYSAGKYYVCQPVEFVSERVCKILGLSVFVLCMILFTLFNLSDKKKSNKIEKNIEVASVNS